MGSETGSSEQQIAALQRQVKNFRNLVLAWFAFSIGILVFSPGHAQEDGTILKAPVRIVDQEGKEIVIIHQRLKGAQIEIRSLGYPAAGISASNGKGTLFYRKSGQIIELGE